MTAPTVIISHYLRCIIDSWLESWANMVRVCGLICLALSLDLASSTFQQLRLNGDSAKYENLLVHIDPEIGRAFIINCYKYNDLQFSGNTHGVKSELLFQTDSKIICSITIFIISCFRCRVEKFLA